MKRKPIIAALLLLVTLSLACRTAPVRDVTDSHVPPGFSTEEVGDIIEQAALRRGWSVVRPAPGRAVASIRVRGRHWARVDIAFDPQAFSIRYRDSENLRYNGERIHRNYNSWILRLERTIHDLLRLRAQTRLS